MEHPRKASLDSLFGSRRMGSGAMGRAPKERKAKRPKERWLLTRKTWRYMADAGRKLIPDGALNRTEDVPKIEAYFQEVCQKEPRFLLWRKGSYPGALGFRSHRRRKDRRIGGSCRAKSNSADEAEDYKPHPSDLATFHHFGGKFDVQKIKQDLFKTDTSPPSRLQFKPPLTTTKEEDSEEHQLVHMLGKYLSIDADPQKKQGMSSSDYQELIDKLQHHFQICESEKKSLSALHRRSLNNPVHVDAHQRGLAETLSRYFSKSTSRQRVISDLLTDRKLLENLYFDLRKSRGFGANRSAYTQKPQWKVSMFNDDKYDTDDEREEVHQKPQEDLDLTSKPSKPKIEKKQEFGIQTDPVSDTTLHQCEEEYKRQLMSKEEEIREAAKNTSRRRSSVDNDDVSQSVSDTIKRYLRMARKKNSDGDKADRFKRINYDKNLRNIKAKNVVDSPSEDDDLNKGCQTENLWIPSYKEHRVFELSPTSDSSGCESPGLRSPSPGGTNKSPASPTSSSFLSTGQHFLSHLLHGGKHQDLAKQQSSSTAPAAMQKSKSSSSVMHHGSRLVAKKIFRSRSKSQSRLQTAVQCSWTPQGGCIWSHVTNKQVMLTDTNLLQLTDIERRLLQKVALAKLQALNLGVTIRPPPETVPHISNKSKRRAYLLRRKAKTTGFFDTGRKDEKEKDGCVGGGLVFGIPISQCIENDRLSRLARSGSPFRSGSTAGVASGTTAGTGDLSGDENSQSQANLRNHGSRSSFSSLLDSSRAEESGSCESLMSRERIAGSVPGLLDALSYGSTADLQVASQEEPGVPHILTACLRYLETHGLRTLGIFRVSSSKKRVRQLREDFDCGKETVLDEEQCPHDVATLLKEYLRDLPDPLLCRELYQPFVQTQRIRNRRLQLEAIQHLVQLLPVPNRDTLSALLSFLANVANNAHDIKDSTGEWIYGNKMDTNNLATIFAPNILHCIKPGSTTKDYGDKSEDRIDVINVVRIMIDHYKHLFTVPAELLDEVYVHMMDTHPEVLDELLSKRDFATISDELLDEADLDSGGIWAPMPVNTGESISKSEEPTQELKKTWSREEFLHENAGMGGPNMAMRLRHKDRERGRERSSKKRWRDESGTRRKVEEVPSNAGGISQTMTIITRFRSQKDDDPVTNQQFVKLRSSSMDGSNAIQNDGHDTRLLRINTDDQPASDRRQSSPLLLDNGSGGVITASLKIPVQSAQLPLGLDDSDIPYIEDGTSCNYTAEAKKQQMTIGLIKGPMAPPRRRQRSASGSDSSQTSLLPVTGSLLVQQGYDSAVGSSTMSTPPQAPSSVSSSVTGEPTAQSSPPSWGSSPPTSPDGVQNYTSVNYLPDEIQTKPVRVIQKVSITSSEAEQVKGGEVTKSPSMAMVRFEPKPVPPAREQKYSTSISSIGGKVLRSKTEDFEKMLSVNKAKTTTTTTTTTITEKKKYTKRRYTDSRHETRHIPDAESLEKASASSTTPMQRTTPQGPGPGTVYKRRELIASVPKERHSIL